MYPTGNCNFIIPNIITDDNIMEIYISNNSILKLKDDYNLYPDNKYFILEIDGKVDGDIDGEIQTLRFNPRL